MVWLAPDDLGQRVGAQTWISGQPQVPAVGAQGVQAQSILSKDLVEHCAQRFHLSGFESQYPRIDQQDTV